MRVLLVTLLFLPSLALADVVGAPPSDCLEGTVANSCHGGPFCEPIRCTTDADCEAGLACEARSLCVGVVNCAGLLGPGEDPRTYDRDTIEGSCDECSTGACNEIRLCVPPLPTGDGGGGCSVGANPGASLLTFGIALLWLRRFTRASGRGTS